MAPRPLVEPEHSTELGAAAAVAGLVAVAVPLVAGAGASFARAAV